MHEILQEPTEPKRAAKRAKVHVYINYNVEKKIIILIACLSEHNTNYHRSIYEHILHAQHQAMHYCMMHYLQGCVNACHSCAHSCACDICVTQHLPVTISVRVDFTLVSLYRNYCKC